MQDFEVQDHLDSLRTINLTNGNKINLKRNDPYGFWSVHYERGQVPAQLQGLYTESEIALQAVKAYIEQNGLEEAEATQEEVVNKKKK